MNIVVTLVVSLIQGLEYILTGKREPSGTLKEGSHSGDVSYKRMSDSDTLTEDEDEVVIRTEDLS